ncbi:ATP-dependent RNA helicase, mitochondrial [Exophiala dermatitidis]
MYGAARQGRLVLRALRSVPSTSFSSPVSRTLPSTSRFAPSKSIRVNLFSSISRYGQQQHAVAEDMGAEDLSHVNREFSTFTELGEAGVLDRRIVNTLANRMNIQTMTEVQRMTINECLDGSDVVAQARTGTGKTLAFLTPIVQRLLGDPALNTRRASIKDIRALILSPTRELAEQIGEEARKIVSGTGVQVQTAVGGTQKRYHLKLMQRMGCHILVGTPGRVKDLLSDPDSGVRLDNIQTFVLDEADRLLDIGFAPDIGEIQSYMPPREQKDRQTLMFSATMPRSVVGLVKQTMKRDFKFVRTIDPNEAATHESVPQNVVYLPGLENVLPTLAEISYKAVQAHKADATNNPPFKAIMFLSTINEVRMAYEVLRNMRLPGAKAGLFAPHPLAPCKIFEMSSRLTQAERTRNSQAFRHAESAILVSSDVAARGMDFPNVTHVIQVGPPKKLEDYVHRIGRTGRAGKSGQGWLILQDDERNEFRQLVRDLHAHNISEDESLETAKLDMTQPTQLSAETGKIMQMVEAGIRGVPIGDKIKAYEGVLASLNQSSVRRPKQTMVEMANNLARYGYGLERTPRISHSFAQKLGFSGVRGLEFNEPGFGGRSEGRRDGFGDRGDRDRQGGGRGGRDFGTGSFGGRGRDRGSRGSFDRRQDFGNDNSSRSGARGGYDGLGDQGNQW